MRKLLAVVKTAAYISKASQLMDEADRVDMIASAPLLGVLIRGTGGLRKMRVALPGRGKRGGGRVIYWVHSKGYPAVLLWAFAKNEASDLTGEQRAKLMKMANALLADFGASK